jgi:hypothetical protein
MNERGLNPQARSIINDAIIWPDDYDSREEEIAEMVYEMACAPRPPMGDPWRQRRISMEVYRYNRGRKLWVYGKAPYLPSVV